MKKHLLLALTGILLLGSSSYANEMKKEKDETSSHVDTTAAMVRPRDHISTNEKEIEKDGSSICKHEEAKCSSPKTCKDEKSNSKLAKNTTKAKSHSNQMKHRH